MKNVVVRKDRDVKASEWMDAVLQVTGGSITESTQSIAKVHSTVNLDHKAGFIP